MSGQRRPALRAATKPVFDFRDDSAALSVLISVIRGSKGISAVGGVLGKTFSLR
jgi:hypothetical protein